MKIQKKEKKKHEKQIGKSFKGNAANINNRSYVQHECICMPADRLLLECKNYATVQSALSAVQNGQTIRLNQDVTLKKTLFFKKNVKYTFDMNKHKVTSKITESNVGDFDVQAGNVTFTNGTTSAAIFVHEKANVTVKDGTIAR